MENYVNEKDSSQVLALTANKGLLGSPEQQGRYFLDNCQGKNRTNCEIGAAGFGRYTRSQNLYQLKEEGGSGKEWKLTLQTDSSLRDENGVIWRFDSHAESDLTVEQNRETCIKLGKSTVC